MGKFDAFAAGFVVAALFVSAAIATVTPPFSPAERRVDREAYGWTRYAEGVTEGARQATLKCPYNYRKKP